MWPVLLLRPYLKETKFRILADHDSLKRTFILSVATGVLGRWRLRLAEFYFDIVHRPDVKNQAADVFSKLETKGEDHTDINGGIPAASMKIDEDRNETIEVPTYTVCLIFHPRYNKSGTLIPKVQALVVQEYPKCDRPSALAEVIAAQAQNPTCQQYAATTGHKK